MATCPSCRTRYADDLATCPVDGKALLPDAAFANADPNLQKGDMVGEYQIDEKLGEGGFGSVYRAVHPLIGKSVAIKVLNRQYSSNPQMVSRFIAEARAVNQIRHRNIIDIFAFGTTADGRQFYVMELLEGMTLDRFIRSRGRLSPEEAIPILRSVGRALDAAHAAGIAHRDLKPENIFLTFDEDGGIFAKLLDFGIAKLLADTMGGAHKTRTGAPIGTPYYMSPEQCRGRNVDQRTDIYSFGVVAHECLTGKLPFEGDDVMGLLLQHTQDPPPPVSQVVPELSSELDGPVLRMLEKEPAARPLSIGAAIDALTAAAERAGHRVPIVAQRSGEGTSNGPSNPPAARTNPTPSAAALAQATTAAQGEPGPGKTRLEAEADVVPSAPRRSRALVAVAAAALGIGLVGTLVLRTNDPSAAQTAAAPPPTAAPAESTAVETAPAQTAVQAAAVMPTTTSAPAPEIAIEIQGAPGGAEVFLGTERLGTGPGPFRVPRSTEKRKLLVKAEGHRPHEATITPDKDVVLSVSLIKAAVQARPGTSGGRPGDLENPF